MSRKIWTPEKVVPHVPQQGIQQTRAFLRGGPYANQKPFIEVLSSVPNFKEPGHKDGYSFVEFINEIAHRTNDIVLVVIEATIVLVRYNCLEALRDSIKVITDDNRLQQRVIPVLVVDQEWSHTRYLNSSVLNPDGPKQVMNGGERLGAITVGITAQTLSQRLKKVVNEILAGRMPMKDQTESEKPVLVQ